MAKRIRVRATFVYTNDEAIERFREGLPDPNAEISSNGDVVRVTAHFHEAKPGAEILREDAQAALRQVRDLGEIAGLGPERDFSYAIEDV
jgi:hypothetical protein